MSTRDREPESPGPLKYAPKWARTAAPEPARRGERSGGELRPVNTRQAERRLPPVQRLREPTPWKLAKQKGSFEGDVAIKELRERMALAPDLPPEPPMRDESGSVFGMIGRLAGLVIVAAIGAYGFVWISTPRSQPDEGGFTVASYEQPAAGEQPGAAPDVESAGVNTSGSGGFTPAVFQLPPAQPPAAAAGLRADALRSRDEAPPVERPQLLAPVAVPWPAPVAGRDLAAKPRETPTTGVAAYSAVPAPADTALPRRAPPAEAETPAARPAVPPAAAAPGSDREDIATLLARGRTHLANGDVSAARLVFRRAAENGDAQAALALGETFDPLVLRSLGAVGVAADPIQARGWYQRAAELGSRDAPQRLNQLAQSTR
jgi:hypothetical protein